MYSFSFDVGYFFNYNGFKTQPGYHYALASKLRHSVVHLTTETPYITESALLCTNVVGNEA